MREDAEIIKDVKAELEWESRLDGSEIEANVVHGNVSLSGTTNSYPKKISAEKAVRTVAGVRSVINDLVVKIPNGLKRSDTDIKRAVMNALTWNSSIDENKIDVEVKNGVVTLEGTVPWDYQRAKARIIAEDITGVTEVLNLINVEPLVPTPHELHEQINAAFGRSFYLNPGKINVQVEGDKVILTGEVRTLAEKYVAENAVWSAPGITKVVNDLEVNYSEIFA